MDPDGRAGRVGHVALDCLQAMGFSRTTLDDVARAAEVDAAALRTRFGDMEGLLADLLSPFLDRLEALAAEAAAADLRRAEQVGTVMAGYVDAVLDHRAVVEAVVADASAAGSEPVRVMRARLLAMQDALTSGPDLDSRIRAASALGAVRAAVLDHDDGDVRVLRAVVTEAAVAILLSAPGTGTGL
jgi:AcrR family transcriptional regulator